MGSYNNFLSNGVPANQIPHDKRIHFYNGWHREALPRTCKMFDLDAVECDAQGNPVAFIEIKYGNSQAVGAQDHLLRWLAANTDVPVYVVYPHPVRRDFTIWQVAARKEDDPQPQYMSETEYIAFMRGLRGES